jgi:N4-gp56 family major capsid protein
MANMQIPNYTAPSDVDLLIPEIWAEKIYSEFQTTTLMERFHGPEGSRSCIIRKTELLGNPGDLINISRINNLTGDGYSGEGAIRGSEEKLVDASVTVTPVRVGNNVAWDWPSDKKSIGGMRQKALAALGYWWATKIDTLAWTAATQTSAGGFDNSAPTRIWSGDATSYGDIDSADVFSPDDIDTMIALLRLNNVPPIIVDGGQWYPVLIHTNQGKSLRDNSTWRQAQRDANVRGSNNPIFSGALGVWNQAIIYESTNCPTTTSTGSPAIKTAVAVAMGVEALCVGEGSNLMWIEDADEYEGYFAVTVRQYLKYEILNHKSIVQCVSAAVDPS